MTDGISNEPVIASTPAPISVEPRTAPPAEAAEVARQAEEAKLLKVAAKDTPKEAVKDEPKPKLSIRESLAAAREKLEAESAPAAKPLSVTPKAEPKVEPAAKETPAAKDAKVAESAATEKPAPARAEDGKFAKAEPEAKPVAAAAAATEAAPKPAPLPAHTASPPPARFSAAAKERWAEAPDDVRAEVSRMEKELTQGFEKHRAAAERDAGLAEFHELAAKGGTDVKTALSKYVAMENQLRADPVKGLEMIAQNAGLSLRAVAAQILEQPPEVAQSQNDERVRTLEARLAKAEAALTGIHTEKQQSVTNSTTEAVTKFAADNLRFEELSDDIAFFLKSGRTKDLAEAYSLAERLNPAPAAPAEAVTAAVASSAPAAATPTPTPALSVVPTPAHTRDAGARSIAGTPTAGSNPVLRQPSNSIREALRKAAAAAG